MIRSFAQIPGALCAVLLAFSTASPAFAQQAEIAAAQAAVQRATQADADQYAPDLIDAARQKVSQAQALGDSRQGRREGPGIAMEAQADADLARVRSDRAAMQAKLEQEQAEIARLRKALATPGAAPAAAPPQAPAPQTFQDAPPASAPSINPQEGTP